MYIPNVTVKSLDTGQARLIAVVCPMRINPAGDQGGLGREIGICAEVNHKLTYEASIGLTLRAAQLWHCARCRSASDGTGLANCWWPTRPSATALLRRYC